jgi:hypothetical protein
MLLLLRNSIISVLNMKREAPDTQDPEGDPRPAQHIAARARRSKAPAERSVSVYWVDEGRSGRKTASKASIGTDGTLCFTVQARTEIRKKYLE